MQDFIKRLTSISRNSEGYAAGVMDVYQYLPKGQFWDDIEALTAHMKVASPNPVYEAKLELGVRGYSAGFVTLTADTEGELKKLIRKEINDLGSSVNASQETHGDLRLYCRENANGYPSVPWGAEFGEDYTVSVQEVKHNGVKLDYHHPCLTMLRNDLGVI